MDSKRYLLLLGILAVQLGVTVTFWIDSYKVIPNKVAHSLDGQRIVSQTPVRVSSWQAGYEQDMLRTIRETIRAELKLLTQRGHLPTENNEQQHANTKFSETVEPSGVVVYKNEQDFGHAVQIIEEAIANGAWSLQDFSRIRQYMSTLTPRQRIALTRKIINAVNRQELRLDAAAMLP